MVKWIANILDGLLHLFVAIVERNGEQYVFNDRSL